MQKESYHLTRHMNHRVCNSYLKHEY